ncbi:MAG TPA: hypothetical protein VMT34_09900 [Aggregatilineales bacterium]|nr:hypothetical protein [Aggregatilineales bacterium]
MEKQRVSDDVSWEHLDYYVRRSGKDLFLVQTALKTVADDPDRSEICTFYYGIDELTDDWANALIDQGEMLEDGKSADFVPPDESRRFRHD